MISWRPNLHLMVVLLTISRVDRNGKTDEGEVAFDATIGGLILNLEQLCSMLKILKIWSRTKKNLKWDESFGTFLLDLHLKSKSSSQDYHNVYVMF